VNFDLERNITDSIWWLHCRFGYERQRTTASCVYTSRSCRKGNTHWNDGQLDI